jgi:hypothetical protein
MMKVIVVFKRLLASGNYQHGRHLLNGGNRWNILGFNFTKRDALSSVYKISMPSRLVDNQLKGKAKYISIYFSGSYALS